MKKILILLVPVFFGLIGCIQENPKKTKQLLWSIEYQALERWSQGDVNGYIDIMAEHATYFDEGTQMRIDNLAEFKSYCQPFAGKFNIPAYKILNPNIELMDNVTLLTYNVDNFDEQGVFTRRWQCTQVYRQFNHHWKIIHSHWSIVRKMPEADL